MDKKCCPRADVQATHWEGCHTIHPECAAYKAGREAGMREAAALADSLTNGYYGHAKAPYMTYRDAILAAIGEGEWAT